MKKAYMKPEIMFESFASSTSIAAGCEEIINTQVLNSCGLEDWPTGTLFMSSMPSTCVGEENQITPNENNDAIHDGICYHVFNGTGNFFNSQ